VYDKSEKFVLCIPHGGLNDSLCQIELCWQYCEREDRKLIIDLSKSGFMVGGFLDYFELLHKGEDIQELDSTNTVWLNSLRCYPHEFKGRIHRISFVWHKETRKFYDQQSGRAITFDFSRRYYENLLIHQQCGGGNLSWKIFDRINFSAELKFVINSRLLSLPSEYVAIHVRNTDYRTNYESELKLLINDFEGKNVLICSDDATVFRFVRVNFTRSKLFTLSEPMVAENRPTHFKSNYEDDSARKIAITNTFIDLMGLAFSNKLYVFNSIAGNRSGFSRLAQYLNENKALCSRLIALN